MAALTQEYPREQWYLPESAPNEMHTQLQNTTIWKGAVAMQVAGVARPAASGVAGSTLLGLAIRTYAAPAGSNKVYPTDQPMLFQRGSWAFDGLAGDLPDDTMIGKPVYFADDNTVKKTAAANDLSGILRKVLPSGQFEVEF